MDIRRIIFLLSIVFVSNLTIARELTADQQNALCNIQSKINGLNVTVVEGNSVNVSWKRVNPAALLQHRLPPRSYPIETYIALDKSAKDSGQLLQNSWFHALEISDEPVWTIPNLSPGQHFVEIFQQSECEDIYDTKRHQFIIEEKNSVEDVTEIEISEEKAKDLSASANLKRYGECMFGRVAQGKAVVSIVRRTTGTFIRKLLSSPFTIAKHGPCLIQATGGLPPAPDDPDRGIHCYPEMGEYRDCRELETFYGSDDGTKALSMMGAGPAPTAVGRDDQARLSCLWTIYNKYNQYARDLNRVFEDQAVISQGCSKAHPQ